MRSGEHNPNLEELDIDFLYHLGLDTSMDLAAMFKDVKYVCMGGSAVRAEKFAAETAEQLNVEVSEGGKVTQFVRQKLRGALSWLKVRLPLKPIGKTERFSLFKAGPVISVSHGMGMPSMSILLHEMTKLLDYAGATDVKFIRIGTSGGVGVEPGTVVITNEGFNGELEPEFEQVVLGKVITHPTTLDADLAAKIEATSGDIRTAIGATMGTNDFYEEQGRMDGALDPSYTEEDKLAFLQEAYEAGVRNIEMESTAFAAFCLRAGIPAAIVCAALLNRLNGDQVDPSKLAGYSEDAQQVVLNFIKNEIYESQIITTPWAV